MIRNQYHRLVEDMPLTTRSQAEYLGGTRVKFTHPCGHTSVSDFSRGPVPKRIGELGVQILLKYWKTGGVNVPCPRCSSTPRRRLP